MNLTFNYMGLNIEGYPPDDVVKIINGTHSTKVKQMINGMLILSDQKIIRCVGNYYQDPIKGPAILKKMSNQCFYVQKDLGIENIPNYTCSSCHLRCIELAKNKQLIRR